MKNLSRLLVSLVVGLGVAANAAASTRVDLNRGWVFTEGGGAPRSAPNRAVAERGAARVDIPHTWNRGARRDYLGIATYSRGFELPALRKDASVYLNFGATFYQARVWLNGVEVGSHEGGYHAWAVDVTKQARSTNYLEVEIDNRPGMLTIPGFGARGAPDAWYDWWTYGGITRDVWLDIHGPVRIERPFIRAELQGARATVTARISLVANAALGATLRARVHAPSGVLAASHEQPVRLAARGNEVSFSMGLDAIQRWDLDQPDLYRLDVEVVDAKGNSLESASDTFGLRDLEIRDRKLFLNGKQVRLTGMTRHADSPWEGAAESRGTLLHDWEDMKSLNMTLTRPVHYAPDPAALDFADRHGILLIPEIPIWQASEAQLSDPNYLRLAKFQMRELIEQAGNHPSVFAWSVLNESAAGSPAGIAFFRAMRAYIRELDPRRPVTLADDNLPKLARADESAANDADFLMMNQYFGAWHGPREALGAALDKVNALFPTKMVIISELGFPGTFAPTPKQADETRVSLLREQLPLLARREWIAGAILWCYQDYKSRRYVGPGNEEGYLEHGIVDPDRQRKPSYFAWRDLNEPAHIEARWTERANGEPAAFAIQVTQRDASELPSRPLDGHQITWQLVDSANKEFAHNAGAAPVQSRTTVATFDGRIPAREAKGPFRLVVKLLRPDGSTAMERVLASP